MGFLSGLWLMVLGILGAASLIIAKRPDAKQYIDKLVPYQGWIGAISAVVGIWVTIKALFAIGIIRYAPIYWISWLAAGLLLIALGLLLGVGVLKSFITQAQAQQKMDQAVLKLAPYQGRLGIVAIIVGLWSALTGLFFGIAG